MSGAGKTAARPGPMPRRQRSAQLLDLALGLIVAEGYEALTMTALAGAAGVSKPIVYRSYPNRAALLLALLRREQRRTERELDSIIPAEPGDRHPRELLLGAVVGILAAVERHPLTWRLVLLPPEGTPRVVRELVERRREQLTRRARRLVAWGRPYLSSTEQLDDDILARTLVSIAQHGARTLLSDPDVGRDALIAMTESLMAEIDWRDGPMGGATE